jgi:hypothetical protein
VRLSVDDGPERALVSVVTFLDLDFRFAALPWFKRSFGQTNYRAYVRDTQTGEYAVWFFGTCLDSASVVVPRYLWRLPWHRAKMEFACRYDQSEARYTSFDVATESRWAQARLSVVDTGRPPAKLAGFANLEAGLVLITHPLRGFFFRQDGFLGSYAIWHDRAHLTVGGVQKAEYPLLQKLGLVELGDQKSIHSVLIQPAIDFAIYLPPKKVQAERLRN